jgi:hypothetical protein
LNAVWDDDTVLQKYLQNMQTDPESSQYQGKYISLVAGFDKMW